MKLLLRVVDCRQCGTENVAHFHCCYRGVGRRRRPPKAPRLSRWPAAPGKFETSSSWERVRDVLRSFTGGERGWESATLDDVFYWLRYLDIHGNGTKLVHARTCPGVGNATATACLVGSGCEKRYATDSLRKGFVSKLRIANKEQLHRGEDWDPASGKDNPCGSPRADSYLTFTTETPRQVGVQVNQAAPLLPHTLLQLV